MIVDFDRILVKVRLTHRGRVTHRRNHEANREALGCKPGQFEYRPVVEDRQGWSAWSMGCLMSDFGSDHTPAKPCFESEMDVEIVKEDE